MFQPWPSLDYSRRSGFSYERWLEDRSHADVVVKALDRGMVERSEEMGDLLQSIDSMAEDQRVSFEQLSSELVGINETLNWGFVELSNGLGRIEEATYAVRDSIDRVDHSINQLILAVNSGFKSVTSGLEIANSHLAIIENATVDVDKAWAISHFKRAVKAMELGFISDSVELLESIINGEAGRLAYKFDYRFYQILGACYSGDVRASEEFNSDMRNAASYFSKAVKYMKMEDGIDESASKICLNSSGWAHYCIGELEASEDFYAKSLGIAPDFDSEFGLAKSIVSANDFEKAADLIKYMIIKYRNFALIKMAGDPDFIHFRSKIISINEGISSDIIAAISQNTYFSSFRATYYHMHKVAHEGGGSRSKLLKSRISEIGNIIRDVLSGEGYDNFIDSDGKFDASCCIEIKHLINSLQNEALSEKYKSWNDDLYAGQCKIIIDSIQSFIENNSRLIELSGRKVIFPDSHKAIVADVPRSYGRSF